MEKRHRFAFSVTCFDGHVEITYAQLDGHLLSQQPRDISPLAIHRMSHHVSPSLDLGIPTHNVAKVSLLIVHACIVRNYVVQYSLFSPISTKELAESFDAMSDEEQQKCHSGFHVIPKT